MEIRSNLPGPLLYQLKLQYHPRSFVETGTSHGETTELAALVFDKVWSCDIDPESIKESTDKLKDYPNVKLSLEPSPEFLCRIKSELAWPVVYWLDAHWSGGPVRPPKECPLLEELEAIGSFNGCSVIIIDDIELMESPPPTPHDPTQWPTLHQIEVALDVWKEPYRLERHQGRNSRLLAVTPRDRGEKNV